MWEETQQVQLVGLLYESKILQMFPARWMVKETKQTKNPSELDFYYLSTRVSCSPLRLFGETDQEHVRWLNEFKYLTLQWNILFRSVTEMSLWRDLSFLVLVITARLLWLGLHSQYGGWRRLEYYCYNTVNHWIVFSISFSSPPTHPFWTQPHYNSSLSTTIL